MRERRFLSVQMRGAIASILLLALLAVPCWAEETSFKKQALEYVKSLPVDTKLYVWPTKLRTYETIGDTATLSDVVSDYNNNYSAASLVQLPSVPAMISIYVYDNRDPGYMARFINQSKMPDVHKRTLGSLQMDYDACEFTNLLSRDTWADGGAIFMDKSRITSTSEERECIEAGLDYINGFPAIASSGYKDFPPQQVRRLVVEAVSACSAEGGSGPGADERTKDGLTPLPQMACVTGKLSN